MKWLGIAGGWALLAAGIVMLVTPGPGLLTMAAGLAVLSTHYKWARRLRERVLREIRKRSGRG